MKQARNETSQTKYDHHGAIDVIFTLSTLKKNRRRQVVIAALCHWTIFE
jgi:hypothetical protein